MRWFTGNFDGSSLYFDSRGKKSPDPHSTHADTVNKWTKWVLYIVIVIIIPKVNLHGRIVDGTVLFWNHSKRFSVFSNCHYRCIRFRSSYRPLAIVDPIHVEPSTVRCVVTFLYRLPQMRSAVSIRSLLVCGRPRFDASSPRPLRTIWTIADTR